jgi:hypothetical protein
MFLLKKYRINKKFFTFLDSISRKTVESNFKKPHANNLDKFYTKTSVAELCVSTFISNVQLQKQDLIIEPSAGNGSFINPLKKIDCDKIFMDIAPENNQVILSDFLNWFPPRISGNIHIIGNPPFGRQSSLCHKFIKHASGFADSISFILPISFKKRHNISRIPGYYHLMTEIPLPRDAFSHNNLSFVIPTIFQIWQKKRK